MNNFPVLQRVRVTDYALYVGTPERPGLDHTFQAGVNVIVGINGLGKTTLLTVLLRAFTGSSDVPGDDSSLGDKRRRLIAADRTWFRRRVPDDAVNAKVTIWFTLGEQSFELTRSLSNLDMTELAVDQQAVTGARPSDLESQYHAHVARASGLTSFDDFVFLLRYVVFYLEDRRSLVWDPAAQGEILSILFGDQSADRRVYVETFNEILSKDSEYRNLRAVLNKRRRVALEQTKSIEGGQLEMLLKSRDHESAKLSELVQRKQHAGQRRDSLRGQIENRHSELYEMRQRLASKLNSYYESFFPNSSDAARYLLSQFESGTGCLVCSSKDANAIKEVKHKLFMNICPVCASPIEDGNANVAHDPYAGEELETLRKEIAHIDGNLQSMLGPLQSTEQEYAQASAEMVSVAAEVASLDQQLRAFGATMEGAVTKRGQLQEQLNGLEAALSLLEVEWKELTQTFRALAQAIDQEVQRVSKQIEDAFGRYIRGFLAEQCDIKYAVRKSSLGQLSDAEGFPFPHFVPALTSGVNRNAATVRDYGQSVSESQREFIDLAFRMALLEIAAPNAPSMLILETPEASLDSVFVPRAGDLLRRFAARRVGHIGTRLIASSNVNRELMIPALFGSYPDDGFYEQVTDGLPQDGLSTVPIHDREAHVLDLLKIAAPTRALEKYRAAYEVERDRAIYPEHFGQPS